MQALTAGQGGREGQGDSSGRDLEAQGSSTFLCAESSKRGKGERGRACRGPRWCLVWEASSRIWGFILRARVGVLKGCECITRFKF